MDNKGKWRIWHGAYSPSASSWWYANPKAKAKAAFPSYNAVTPQNNATASAGSVVGPSTESGGLVTDMQAALNIARKAELRVTKLHNAYEAAQEQWAAYDKAAKENYQKERRRYQKFKKTSNGSRRTPWTRSCISRDRGKWSCGSPMDSRQRSRWSGLHLV